MKTITLSHQDCNYHRASLPQLRRISIISECCLSDLIPPICLNVIQRLHAECRVRQFFSHDTLFRVHLPAK